MNTELPPGGARARLGRNIRWLALMQALTLFIRFVPLAYVARKLGPTGLGQWVLGFVWMDVMSDVHGLSLEDLVPRNVAQKPDSGPRLVLGTLIVTALVTPLIALGAFVLNLVYGDRIGVSFFAILLASLVRTPTRGFLSFYAARENLKPFSIWQSGERIGIALVAFFALALGGGVKWVFWSMPVLYLILGIPVWRSTIRRFGIARVPMHEVVVLVKQGAEFTWLRFVSILYGRIDIILVERLLDIEAAGFYGAARRPLDVLKSLPMLVAKGIYPLLSRKIGEGRAALGKLIERFEKMMVIYSAPFVVGGALLAYPLMRFVYGGGFEKSAGIFVPLVWTLLLGSVRRPVTTYLTAEHRQNRASAILLSGVVVNVVLSFTLIPATGLWGAVIAVVAAELLSSLLLFRELHRERIVWSVRSVFMGPLLASLALAAVVFALRGLPLVVVILAGGVAYGASLLLLGGLDREERAWTWRMLKLRA